MVCPKCGSHLYPPSEVSSIGVEDYEEVYPVMPLKPEKPPTEEDLYALNKETKQLIRIYPSIDDFIKEYTNLAKTTREQALSEARKKLEELKDKLRDIQLIEEDKAIKLKGKRFKAVYVKNPVGWTLKCPNCNTTLINFTKY
jgi:DNA repair exonuclease SbcCD ATPase subunit